MGSTWPVRWSSRKLTLVPIDRQAEVHPKDTTASAREAQLAIFRELGPSGRVALACNLSDGAISLTADGMRFRNPGMSDEDVADAIRRLLLGPDLAQRLRSMRARSA